MASSEERRQAERRAHDEMCKAMKEDAQLKGKERTGESIEREVRQIAERVERRKGHKIYQ